MAQNVVFLGECSIRERKECAICCCWMKSSMEFNYIHLIDSVVEFNYVLTNFLQLNLSISGGRLLNSPTEILDEIFWVCFRFCLT